MKYLIEEALVRKSFYENDAYCEDHQNEVEEECFMETQDQNFVEGDSYNESTPSMEEYDENKEPTLHHDWLTYVNIKIDLLKEEIEEQFLSTPNF